MNDVLVQHLVCPSCHSSLHWTEQDISCAACPRRYPISDGIPIMLADVDAEDEQPATTGHAMQQAAFYDQHVNAEWEISRPRGAPRLYRWFLEEKFRRSIRGLEPMLPGATVLTVCGGSGMEADFLARAGATVISSDISFGAVQRAKARAQRYGLSIIPLVAAADRLPFPDHAIDLVYVHDGLHHTAAPDAVLREMARVARKAVSVTEPAQAFLTALAVRLDISPDYAAAGNRIARLAPQTVQLGLMLSGLSVLQISRYAMYYKWHPGPYMQLFSQPGLFHLVSALVLLGNLVLGRWGNKFVVTAVYPGSSQVKRGSLHV